jgi:hypothetical protein
MGIVAATELVGALRLGHLLDAEKLAETARLQATLPNAKALAGDLIRRGWLTAFQANLLLQGRGQELRLGSYLLLERLGEGGMGTVYKARQRLGRTVAIKVIRKDRIVNPQAVKRFQREIRAAAQLDHPNIVRAFDADEIDGNHLLVMEYVENGMDLDRLITRSDAGRWRSGWPNRHLGHCHWCRAAPMAIRRPRSCRGLRPRWPASRHRQRQWHGLHPAAAG